ncbi:MAG TPA: rhodanese-like domain-containing protein [Alphaproteobacteria bacterium]|nr:rhodanese-like domain-containing protein [Alphaproteobacteria bacterium]
MPDIPAIEVEELRDRLRAAEPPLVLDVREPWEAEICCLPDSVLIPLGSLPQRVAELPRDRAIVVHCHHGGRSARAVAFLRQQGFAEVFNLTGGIHDWACRVDSKVKTYG